MFKFPFIIFSAARTRRVETGTQLGPGRDTLARSSTEERLPFRQDPKAGAVQASPPVEVSSQIASARPQLRADTGILQPLHRRRGTRRRRHREFGSRQIVPTYTARRHRTWKRGV